MKDIIVQRKETTEIGADWVTFAVARMASFGNKMLSLPVVIR